MWIPVLGACRNNDDGGATPLNGAAPAIAEDMKDHYASAIEYRDWVIADDIEHTGPPAVWLADHIAPDGLPKEWAAFATDMRGVASAAAKAKDLPASAKALSALARTCARCHAAHNAEIKLSPKPPTPFTDDVGKVMFGHQYAANRMWEGLFIPSDAAWNEGCEQMAGSTLRPADVENLAQMDAQVVALEEKVHRLAADGANTTDPLERGKLYTELVQTCASCHRWFAEH